MEKLLKLMLDGEALSTEQMGKILGYTKEETEAELKKLSDAGILLGWRPVINTDIADSLVHAAIELRINPERDGGFDRLAQRISKFEQVDSCYLMSGARNYWWRYINSYTLLLENIQTTRLLDS